MNICDKCSAHGLRFERQYKPIHFFEGRLSSRIWIIGLNPKNETRYQDHRDEEQLHEYFDQKGRIHGYFHDFRKVSKRLYDLLGAESGAGHTDLVKCFSPEWPPNGAKGAREKRAIVANCDIYLREQIAAGVPDIIVCNGAPVCEFIRGIVQVEEDHGTYYFGKLKGRRIAVVLSGFIGRIDNFAKRRLGREIEGLMEHFGI